MVSGKRANGPKTATSGRHRNYRNALYRFLKEDGGEKTSHFLIEAFEHGLIRNSRGGKYLVSGPSNPNALSRLLCADSRFYSTETQRLRVGQDGGTYTVLAWGVF